MIAVTGLACSRSRLRLLTRLNLPAMNGSVLAPASTKLESGLKERPRGEALAGAAGHGECGGDAALEGVLQRMHAARRREKQFLAVVGELEGGSCAHRPARARTW